jgi:hypothetical protein
MNNLIVNLPLFPGFYESILSQSLDHAVTQEAENLAERESSEEYYPDEFWPQELRLDHSEFWDSVSFGDAYTDMARDWVQAFDLWMNENMGTPEGSFTFESMTSPRFYNFETDRVFCFVPQSVMESLYAGIDVEKLRETIESRHTSRSGFISFYENDLDSWQEKIAEGLQYLDHNELQTILCAAIADLVAEESRYGEGLNWTLCESIMESDYEYLDRHTDWQGYESKCQQWRAEKLAALIETDADQAARLIAGCERVAALESLAVAELDSDTRALWQGKLDARPYRCPETADLFAGERGAA